PHSRLSPRRVRDRRRVPSPQRAQRALARARARRLSGGGGGARRAGGRVRAGGRQTQHRRPRRRREGRGRRDGGARAPLHAGLALGRNRRLGARALPPRSGATAAAHRIGGIVISSLRGVVAAREPVVVVDVGGVGFAVQVSARTAARIPARGDTVALHTYLHV